METMIGYCGLTCTECEAYLATQAKDREALEQMAARAREQFGVAEATAESVLCDGCKATTGRQCGYCDDCQVRACAVGRGVANCAHCQSFGCEVLEGFLGMAPSARQTLDRIRAGLVD
jgi:hypothetical protein